MPLTSTDSPLEALGIHVFDDAVDATVLGQVAAAMAGRETLPATIYRSRRDRSAEQEPESVTVDEGYRRSKQVVVPDAVRSSLEHVFDSLSEPLGRLVEASLASPSSPSFLRYEPGDFFLPHRDGGDGRGNVEIDHRALSVVLFVNDYDGEPWFAGGELVLMPFEDVGPHGVVVSPKRGRMVVFPPTMIHEVKPVTSGVRYSVVTWYHTPDFAPCEAGPTVDG